MKYIVKKFEELTTVELYEILKLRSEIFVVEQNCVYQDLDDIDYQSLHIICEENHNVLSYLRIYPKRGETDVVQIGRVVTLKHRTGSGRALMQQGIQTIKDTMNYKKIYIVAQKQAIGFYEKFGFIVTSDEFLEDGIPHVAMELTL
ncbi:MAG: GNAT family N-acetyltransferase [Lachnospiraceae bacterium]|nr:GNAT family N-acetyltransferase [Lachnospiraceae bacterium]